MQSFSGITTYGKVSASGPEQWFVNHSVMKDPPKSGTCRRIDKVSDTNQLIVDIERGDDRFSGGVQRFARGINPAVAVDFGNRNVAGGILSRNLAQPYYAHTVGKDGAFRPPVVAPQHLLPLSRQPRVFTRADTNKSMIDYSVKRWGGCSEVTAAKSRDVRKDYEQVYAQAVSSLNIMPQLNQPPDYHTNPFIKDTLVDSMQSSPSSFRANRKLAWDPYLLAASAHSKVQSVSQKQRDTNKSGPLIHSGATTFNRLNPKVSASRFKTEALVA